MSLAVGRAELPSLALPEEDEGFVHIKHLYRDCTFCGIEGPGTHHRTHGWNIEFKECGCGAPVCPVCDAISETLRRTGAYEGA